MGRHKKYKTDEERKAANNEKVKRFYWANKEECDRKARERYHRKKFENPIIENPPDDLPDEVIEPTDE